MFPVRKEEDISTVVNYELGITTNLNNSRSHGNFRPHECNGLQIPQCVSQPRICPGSVAETQSRKEISFENPSDCEKSSGTMLSSMVSVLAPPWSSRPRRPKRFDETSNSYLQNAAASHEHGFKSTQNQPGVGLHTPRSVSFLDSRRNTVDWSTKSDPSSLDFESKRKMTQTVSLDLNGTSPSHSALSPWSPLPLDQNDQRSSPRTGQRQERLSSMNSKPTTSTLLLSIRRSNNTNSNTSFIFPEVNSTLSTSPNHQNGKLLTHLPQTSCNNDNEQDRPTSLLSPLSISYKTPETVPVLSPASSNHRDNSFTLSPQAINMTQASLASSKLSFQGNKPEERQHNSNTNPVVETSIFSPRHYSYEHPALAKTRSLPRRTTLTNTSWWKQVSQDGGSPLSHNNVTNIKDEPNADAPRLADNKRLASQNFNNTDDNGTAFCKGNMNLTVKMQSAEPKRINQQLYDSNLDNRELKKTHSMPDCLPNSKLSRAPPQITLRPIAGPNKRDLNNTFTENSPEKPTSFKPNTLTPPTNGSKYNTNITPSPHNMNSQTSALPHDFAMLTHIPSQTSSKNTFSFQSPVPSMTSTQTSSSGTPNVPTKTTVSPLGFERSYACLPKHFHSKTASSLISKVESFTRTKGSPLYTSPATFSSTSPCSPSNLSPSVPPDVTSPISVAAYSPLTPPATPGSPSFNSETTIPKVKSILTNSPENKPKKPSLKLEKKRERRVTWGDSVDVQCSETDSSPVQTNPPSFRSPQSTSSTMSSSRSENPEVSTSSVCSPNPKAFSIQVVKEGNYHSLSSDSADLATREHENNKHTTGDALNHDQARQGLNTASKEWVPSLESGTVQSHSSAPRSLPPDFSNGLKIRYSTPPYSTLMSSRQTQGEKKTITLSQPSQLSCTPQTSLNNDLHMTSTTKFPLTPARQSQPFSIQRANATQDRSNHNLSDTDKVNNNHVKDQEHASNQIQLLDNRVQISSESLSGDDGHTSSSTFVTETLVYSIKCKGDTAPRNATPKSLQHNTSALVSVETNTSQQLNTVQSKETCSHSDLSNKDNKPTDSQASEIESNNESLKESMLSKNKSCSVEVNDEQSQKKGRCPPKRSVSTPNSTVSRSESEKVCKGSNKMDQMLNKLKQKFTKRSDDESAFSWKWRRNSQTLSVSGSSDVSDSSADGTRAEKKAANDAKTDAKQSKENRYTIVPSLTFGETKAGEDFTVWPEKSAQGVIKDEQNTCEEQTSKSQVHLTVHSPANQFVPGSDPISTAVYTTQYRKSTPSPRSPFSPFSSLSPVSPFSSPDVADDSVFYSPKPQRRRESSSQCEPREEISLEGSRRRRASTGPPSLSPGVDTENFASSYADLKYGIEPGKSFSVSSVLSSRPSKPGRISTGSRFMSVGDLSQSASPCAGNGNELNRGSLTPDQTGDFGFLPIYGCQMSDFPCDSSKMRSRSLPRSLIPRLANWSSGVPSFQSMAVAPSKPSCLRSPIMNIRQLEWDAESPPTPPPTPPLSPVSRRMSKPPSLSSPVFSGSRGAVQQVDSQTSRGHLPYGGYRSSLSTFDESSDSSSDTTTDDEYYLEEGKETEL